MKSSMHWRMLASAVPCMNVGSCAARAFALEAQQDSVGRMARSLRSQLEESTSSLLARAGKFSNRVGNKLTRMSVNASPWQHAIDTRPDRPDRQHRRAGATPRLRQARRVRAQDRLRRRRALPATSSSGSKRALRALRGPAVAGLRRRRRPGDRAGSRTRIPVGADHVDDQGRRLPTRRGRSPPRRHHSAHPRAQRRRRSVDDPDLCRHVRSRADRPRRGGVPRRRPSSAPRASSAPADPKTTVTVPVISLPELIREHRLERADRRHRRGRDRRLQRHAAREHRADPDGDPSRIGSRTQGVRQIFRDLDDLGFVYDIKASLGSSRVPP